MGFFYAIEGLIRGLGNTAVTNGGGTPRGASQVTTGTMFSFSGPTTVGIDVNGDGQSLNSATIVVDGGQFYRLDGIINGGAGSDTLIAGDGDDGILNQPSGDCSDNMLIGGRQIAGPAALSGITRSSLFKQTGVACFVAGTEIATARGLTLVERLKVGDRVITRDSGVQEIRWIGSKKVSAIGKLAPIRIAPGVLGSNDQYLWLSPNHRVLITSGDMGVLFGESEVLVAAKHLVGQPGITRQPGGMVEYFHILFDAHELVLSNDLWTESFFPGSQVLSQDNEMREEILNLFPELGAFEEASNYGKTVRVVLNAHDSKLINLDRAV